MRKLSGDYLGNSMGDHLYSFLPPSRPPPSFLPSLSVSHPVVAVFTLRSLFLFAKSPPLTSTSHHIFSQDISISAYHSKCISLPPLLYLLPLQLLKAHFPTPVPLQHVLLNPSLKLVLLAPKLSLLHV